MQRLAVGILRPGVAPVTRQRDPSGDSALRTYVFDDAFSPVWDLSIIDGMAGRGPAWWRMAREIQRRHAEYDGVVTWGERLSLALLAQQQFAPVRKPHIAMMYQFEKPNVRLPLSLLKQNLHAVVTWSTVQRRALIERLGYPAGKVYLIRHYVDQLFYRPRAVEEDMICAAGAEMRDYATFKAAMRGTGLRCHIAADHVRVPGRLRLLNDRRIAISDVGGAHDAGLTEGRKSLPELRDLYARSRFVVVPLLPSDTDNGVTCILEAMAMGKPVICSRTKGQVDVVREGETGLYVPVGDAAALRAAILALWNDPARARAMGRNARAYVEKYHTLEMFTATAKSAAVAALEGHAAPNTWWE
jgi:glycosyltransferase involved in cell wall biosynthesis